MRIFKLRDRTTREFVVTLKIYSPTKGRIWRRLSDLKQHLNNRAKRGSTDNLNVVAFDLVEVADIATSQDFSHLANNWWIVSREREFGGSTIAIKIKSESGDEVTLAADSDVTLQKILDKLNNRS